ncbi:MAG: hypothetical protein EHM13_15325 [Acidobacteria bacterium]|nr:MAG: hypothetical protein EHM13_15325 [Acidobacteriota bacterium]
MSTISETPAKRDPRAFLAYASLVLAVLDLPALACGFLGALSFGMSGSAVLMVVALGLPVLLCVTGIILGVVGLASRPKWAALIGIVLPVAILLLGGGFFLTSMIIQPANQVIFTAP